MSDLDRKMEALDCQAKPKMENQQDELEILPSEDMMNMFASVWVKVEVDDDDERPPRKRSRSRKKQHPRRITKTYQCTVCDYNTIYKNCFEVHAVTHTNDKPYACESCSYTTKYSASLQRHTLMQHDFKKPENEYLKNELKTFKCTHCSYITYLKWNLKAHQRKHFLDKQYKCEHCTYSTAYRHNFLKHSKVHNNKQQVEYKCDKCPFRTKYEGHITRHLAQIHREVSETAKKCELCDFSTRVRWRLNIHYKRSKQDTVINCPHCDFQSFYTCQIKKHKLTHYSELDSKSLLANNSDNSEKNVVNNESTSLRSEPESQIDYNNDDESNVYQTQNELEKTAHEKNNHYTLDPNREIDWKQIQVTESNDKEKPFQCVQCDYTSRFKASVQRHFQRLHTGNTNRPYKCLNCDFSTKTKDQISLHNKRSQSDKQLSCKICNFQTYFKCQFLVHQKDHYVHKCSLCSYSCKHKYDVQKHFSIAHLGNCFKCRFCDYRSSRRESMQNHETVHTGEKPFQCTHCSYNSVRKCLLYGHMKRCHNIILTDEFKTIDDKKIESLKVIKIDNNPDDNMLQDFFSTTVQGISNDSQEMMNCQGNEMDEQN